MLRSEMHSVPSKRVQNCEPPCADPTLVPFSLLSLGCLAAQELPDYAQYTPLVSEGCAFGFDGIEFLGNPFGPASSLEEGVRGDHEGQLDSSIVERMGALAEEPAADLDETDPRIDPEEQESPDQELALSFSLRGELEKGAEADPKSTDFEPSEADAEPSKACCSCRKSRCLKLYCECFARGGQCSSECSCMECLNSGEHPDLKQLVVEEILSKNPCAFSSRFQLALDPHSQASRGCGCKKTGCQKRYCECFTAGLACTSLCRCCPCENHKALEIGLEGPPRSKKSPRNKRSFIESLTEKLRIIKQLAKIPKA